MKNKLVIFFFILFLILLTSCENVSVVTNIVTKISEEDVVSNVSKNIVETPVISVSEDGILSSMNSTGSTSYEVELIYEDEELKTSFVISSLPYEIETDRPGVYSIRIRALPKGESEVKSNWSNYCQFCSSKRDEISRPQNLKVENNVISFGKNKNASSYEIKINDESIISETNKYEYNFIPGIEYKIKVKACVNENLYTVGSPWTDEIIYSYTVELAKPIDLLFKEGILTWNAERAINGFTVCCKNNETNEEIEYIVKDSSFSIATLNNGTYTIKVKTNGIGTNSDSEYSIEKKFSVSHAYHWSSSDIVSNFSGWNNATIRQNDGYAEVVSNAGWGGIISPYITVDYKNNPYLIIDYKRINYGYLGKYITPTNQNGYYFKGDTLFEGEDVIQVYQMDTYVYGKIPNTVSENFSIIAGFTGSPTSGYNTVLEIRSIDVVYINEIK